MRLKRSFTALLLLVTVSCSRSDERHDVNVCEALRDAPALLGKQVTIMGWYGAIGFAGSAIGSGKCPQTLIEPRFTPSLEVELADKQKGNAQGFRDILAGGSRATDFSARFTGTLSKRTGQVQSGPVPPDAALNLDDMPYVFDVERIDDLRVERATFLPEPPPETP
ncbi:hypothetical protein [Sphingomonas flavescens]|uniref:hypothetical protein n=1 Tax=Sphingomonas flavescens TaxID=3132797 RepID=UPI002804595E|nr:hypothetical protein [Sphingomonas limnosediminicola]